MRQQATDSIIKYLYGLFCFMLILAPYADTRKEDTEPTRLFLQGLPKDKYDVLRLHCLENEDYFNYLGYYWGLGDFIILEHDNLPTLEMLDRLVSCKEILCVQAYPKHFPEKDVCMHRKSINPVPDKAYAWLNEGEEWADRWGLGVAKITKAAQDMVNFQDIPSYWMNIDNELSKRYEALGIKAHVHWPAAVHNHKG